MRGTERPRIPHLRRAWEILEDPDARRRQKVDALQRIAWFETRAFAQRLLAIPDSTLADVQAELDECFRRMAVRRSYCLGAEGARKLAAIAAVGAPPRMQLSRTIDDEYPSDQFLTDLSLLLRIRSEEDHPTIRGPHPRLRTKPEEFLSELAERFPTSKSVTGWDWRGDLYLAFGPAQYCQDEQHLAHYVYGYPASYGIRAGVLGAVDAVPAGGRIQTHIDYYYRNTRRRRTQVQTAIDELEAAIPEASTATAALLGHLHRLLPPRAISAGLLIPAIALDISADVVVFPDSTESLDMMASIGIPFDELYMSRSGPGLRTLLETCCFLLRRPQYIVWSERHDGGFIFEIPSGSTKHLHLVDTFRCRVEPEDYILYCSALDPITGKSGGIVLFLDLQTEETAGPILSPIALADKVDSEVTEEAFVRGGYRIVPYPGRNLLYGEDIWLYFEIRGLEKSDYGDYAWEESYYFIPDHINAGIVRILPGMIHNSIRPSAERSFMIDLATMESEYQGPIIIVILITDVVSGRNALTAARFTISRR